MLWLIMKDSSHQIISCNTHEREGVHEVWVERVNGKSMKVEESGDAQLVADVREAIDFAIHNGHRTLNLN